MGYLKINKNRKVMAIDIASGKRVEMFPIDFREASKLGTAKAADDDGSGTAEGAGTADDALPPASSDPLIGVKSMKNKASRTVIELLDKGFPRDEFVRILARFNAKTLSEVPAGSRDDVLRDMKMLMAKAAADAGGGNGQSEADAKANAAAKEAAEKESAEKAAAQEAEKKAKAAEKKAKADVDAKAKADADAKSSK